jgi:hypothetical protein
LDWLGDGAKSGTDDRGIDDFTDWSAALAENTGSWALLSGERLWRMGLRLGAGRHRLEIARLIWRDDVTAFKAAASEDAYHFALRQAPMVWRDAPLADEAESAVGATLADRVSATAGLGLGCWLAALPEGLAARARMKLPPAHDTDFAAAAAWPEKRRSVWLGLLAQIFALEA